MKILAVNLGKFKSTACVYDTETAQHTFQTLPARPQGARKRPDSGSTLDI